MRFEAILDKIKKGLGPNNAFFHGNRPVMDEEDRDPGIYRDTAQSPAQGGPQYYAGAPQADAQYYANALQNIARQPYAPYPQDGYQQPQQYAQPYAQQSVQEPYIQPRNRRSDQARPDSNVVQFPGTGYAQPAAQPPQGYRQPPAGVGQPMQQGYQPAQQGFKPMQQGYAPQAQAAYQQPASPQPDGQAYAQTDAAVLSARVINVRSIADCRNAISFLRAGDCVTAVMDNITDPGEMRRYVDTLNGASFSLGCTLTRVSLRFGVYLLAPASVLVYTDQVTTQMNTQSRAPQRPRAYPTGAPAHQGGYDGPYQQPLYDQPRAYDPAYAAPQGMDAQYAGSFSKQAAAPIPQPPAGSYSQQPPAYGYSPDAENDRSNAM
jgi:FtsZ-interacting cell division protein YlmF